VQPSVTAAFDATRESKLVQSDAGKQGLLAVSLLYTECTVGELPEPLLTVREAAGLLGLAPGTVYGYCASGKLRHTRVAWAVRIARPDLEAFIAEGASGGAGGLAPAQPDEGGSDAPGDQYTPGVFPKADDS
jgi:excisionase family DNA binding protein